MPAAALAALLAAPAFAGVPGMMGGEPAASPVRTHPLAAGEELIETGGVGMITARADLATITVTITSYGMDVAEARRANRIEIGRVAAAARAAGVPSDAIEVRSGDNVVTVRFVDVPENAPPPPSDISAPGTENAAAIVTIRLRDVERAGAVRAALQAAGSNDVSPPLYSLTDRTHARHQAQAQALAAARADAEAQAAQHNMRVIRLVRVTERIGTDIYAIAFNNAGLFQSVSRIQNPGAPQPQPEIVTVLLLGADFALAPR
ncbi:MAG TPA: SIMPL domain-containing protein [Allosphingosinicella sp.]|nr:SIMPL domain-containing protein [Allosphingosinicella sp.]